MKRFLKFLLFLILLVVLGNFVLNEIIPRAKVLELAAIPIPDWIDQQIIDVDGDSRRGVRLEGIEDIVIHYVGNPGTTAQQNRDYFDNPSSDVSSHFVIGLDGEIIQCIPLQEKSSASNHRNIILQALSQLKRMYKDDWEELISNCDSMLFLGSSDKTTLEYISQSLGKETIRTVNNSLSKGTNGNYSTSYNKTGRELATPTELRRMNNKNCVYLLRGIDPFFSLKYKIERHPNYRSCGAGNKKFLYDVKMEKSTGR